MSRQVVLCLLTSSSDIRVSVRFFFFLSSRPFSVKHFAYVALAVLCLSCQVVVVQQRSWKLYDDWKEVAHSRSGIREGQTTNRAMAGSGNRGRRVNLGLPWMGLRPSEALLLSTMHPAFARADSSEIPQVSNLCALPVVKFSGATFPKATLSQSYWLQRTRIGWLGKDLSSLTLSRPSCNQHRASPRRRLRPLDTSWDRRNLSTTKPLRMRGSWRRSSRNRPRPLKSCGKQLQSEQDMLGRLGPALSQAKETTKESLDELRVMRIAVHGAGADGDKNAPRPAPMEQDTGVFQTKDPVTR